jgi:hypothetical protein
MTCSETTSVVAAVERRRRSGPVPGREARRLDSLEELVELQVVPEVGVSVAVRKQKVVSGNDHGDPVEYTPDLQLGVATVESPSTFLVFTKDVDDLQRKRRERLGRCRPRKNNKRLTLCWISSATLARFM